MKIFKFVLIVLGILLLLNAVVLAIATVYTEGLVLVIGMGGLLIIYGITAEKLMQIKWLTAIIITGFSAILCFVSFLGVYGAIDNTTFTEDAVIVLGQGSKDGKPAPQAVYRLDKAVEYNKKNPNAIIIVSAGRADAIIMEKYLVQNGVLQEKIIREEKATDTGENFIYSKQILDNYLNKDYKSVFITNTFHVYRADRIAKVLGIEASHFHAKIDWYDVTASYLRECGAIVREILLGRMF